MENFIKVIVIAILTIGAIFIIGWIYTLGFNYLIDYFEFQIKEIGIWQGLLIMFLMGGFNFISSK